MALVLLLDDPKNVVGMATGTEITADKDSERGNERRIEKAGAQETGVTEPADVKVPGSPRASLSPPSLSVPT